MAVVTVFRNPLNPRAGMIQKSYSEDISIGEISADLELENFDLAITINGYSPEVIGEELNVYAHDIVEISIVPEGGGGDSSKVVSQIINAALIVGGAISSNPGLIVAGVAGFVGTAINALSNNNVQIDDAPTNQSVPSSFTISSAGNRTRLFQGLPIALSSEIRMSPDFQARPYSFLYNFKTESRPLRGWVNENYTVNYSTSLLQNTATGYPFNFRQQSYSNGFSNLFSNYFDLSAPRSNPSLISVDFGRNDRPVEDFPDPAFDNGIVFWRYGWIFFDNPSDPNFGKAIRTIDLPVLIANGNDITMVSSVDYVGGFTDRQRVAKIGSAEGFSFNQVFRHIGFNHVFNFGYGDINLSDTRIGTNEITSLPDSIFYGTNISPTQNTTTLESNVISVSGGELRNSGSSIGHVSAGKFRNVERIEVEIEGRQFRSNPTSGEIEGVTRSFRLEVWQDGSFVKYFDNTTNITPDPIAREIDVFSASTFPVREISFVTLTPQDIETEVRVFKLSPEEDQREYVSDLRVERVKFFRQETNLNPAQNIVSARVAASEKLTGSIGNLSSIVSAKVWKYDSIGDTYTWDYSSNPADMLLYVLLGGFILESTGSGVFPESPTIGWSTNQDNTGAGERLFGAGVSIDQIDLDSIKEWHAFCESNNYTFSAILDSDRNAWDVISDIAKVGLAQITRATGRIGVYYESALDVPVGLYGEMNIIKDSFNVSYSSLDIPDAIEVSYLNKDNDWSEEQVICNRPNVTDVKRVSRVSLWGVTDLEHATRLGNLIAAENEYRNRSVSFDLDLEHLMVTRGDVILVSSTLMGWDSSDRVNSFTIANGELESFTLYSPSDEVFTHAKIRTPSGSVVSVEILKSGDTYTLTSGSILAAELPRYMDSELNENMLSSSSESCPEDLMLFLSDSADIGKPMRITSISPNGENQATITCVDEEPAIYAYEFNNLPSPVATSEVVEEPKKVVSISNLSVIDQGSDYLKLGWNSENSIGALVYYSVNGGVEIQLSDSGRFSFFECAKITAQGSISVRVEPLSIGSPYQSESQALTVNV